MPGSNLHNGCIGRQLNESHSRHSEVPYSSLAPPAYELLASGLVRFTGNHHLTIGEGMKRRLLVIVDHPIFSVAALENRSYELFPTGATDVAGSADDSFEPKFPLSFAHA